MRIVELTRRDFVAVLGAGLAGVASLGRAQSSGKLYAYVGSWTQGPFGVGGGGGITVFAVDRGTGALTQTSRTGPQFDNLNAGYLAISPRGRVLYSTNEVKNRDGELGSGGAILSFSIDRTNGSLTHMNTQPSMGVNPAYVTIDATGSVVVASNHGDYVPAVRVTRAASGPTIEKVYDDGTVVVLPVNADGTLAPPSDVAILDRMGSVDPISQRNPHAHSVNFDPSNRFVVVCDKGADRIYSFLVDTESGTLTGRRFVTAEPGVSPRHSAFHPRLPYVFIVHERQSSIAAYRYDSVTGALEHIQTIATIPSGFTARNMPADVRVHPNGRFVYSSNRGHDSIAIFRLDDSTGRLTSLGTVPCGGAGPRGINLDPSAQYLYAANLDSSNVAVFRIDSDDGMLTPTGATADVLKPACIKFLEA